jgi:glycosyltransferase involved in cell wall biosynthesis
VDFSEGNILNMVLAFYKMGDVLYAPNDELVRMLAERTQKPVFLMKRGIDTELFHPARRTVHDDVLRLGFVGRVTPEKSVRFLRELEVKLLAAGTPTFRFVVIGDGSEREWLRENLTVADFAQDPARRGTGAVVREYGCLRVSFVHGYVWEYGAGGVCVGSAGGGDRCGRTEVYCPGWGIGVRGGER